MARPAVRPAGPGDAAAVAEIYAAYVGSSAATFEEVAPSPAEMAQRMTRRPLLPWLVAEAPGGGVLGFAYAGPHHQRSAYRWSVNCSVYLRADAQGSGVAAALYDELIRAVRDLGYVSAYAGIALPNDASVALHERFGFRPVGTFPASGFKLGQWRDVGWWWRPLRDPPQHPEAPADWQPGR